MGKFATAINCMDGRVQIPVIEYIKDEYGVDYVDMITLPGPNKVLVENKNKTEQIKRYVEISVGRHGSRLVAICGHYDCAGNPVDDKTQIKQIQDAIDVIKSWNLNVQVTGLWINQNWKVEKVK
jgi:carbonic anhydrase